MSTHPPRSTTVVPCPLGTVFVTTFWMAFPLSSVNSLVETLWVEGYLWPCAKSYKCWANLRTKKCYLANRMPRMRHLSLITPRANGPLTQAGTVDIWSGATQSRIGPNGVFLITYSLKIDIIPYSIKVIFNNSVEWITFIRGNVTCTPVAHQLQVGKCMSLSWGRQAPARPIVWAYYWQAGYHVHKPFCYTQSTVNVSTLQMRLTNHTKVLICIYWQYIKCKAFDGTLNWAHETLLPYWWYQSSSTLKMSLKVN